MENKEVRFIGNLNATDTNTITGTAIVFNQPSEKINGEFREIILPDAVTPELIKNSDIFMLYNHSFDNGVLARSKNGEGTLNITIDDNGVNYSFDIPESYKGLKDSIKRGDITSCSFAFTVSPSGQKWENRNGEYTRTITKFDRLYDFSIVAVPAYSQTTVSARGLEELKEAEKKELAEIKKKEDDLNAYYSSYDDMIKVLKK